MSRQMFDIPRILRILLCRKTSRDLIRLSFNAQLSHPQSRRLSGIAIKIKYLLYSSTSLHFQKECSLPIAYEAAAIRIDISISSCRLYDKLEPRYLNWQVNVIIPSAMMIGFVSSQALYILFSLSIFALQD